MFCVFVCEYRWLLRGEGEGRRWAHVNVYMVTQNPRKCCLTLLFSFVFPMHRTERQHPTFFLFHNLRALQPPSRKQTKKRERERRKEKTREWRVDIEKVEGTEGRRGRSSRGEGVWDGTGSCGCNYTFWRYACAQAKGGRTMCTKLLETSLFTVRCSRMNRILGPSRMKMFSDANWQNPFIC